VITTGHRFKAVATLLDVIECLIESGEAGAPLSDTVFDLLDDAAPPLLDLLSFCSQFQGPRRCVLQERDLAGDHLLRYAVKYARGEQATRMQFRTGSSRSQCLMKFNPGSPDAGAFKYWNACGELFPFLDVHQTARVT
jgi:hypothetical protein